MKLLRCAVVVAVVASLCACGESSAGDTAHKTADSAMKSMESIDFSKLTPTALAEKAKTVYADLARELSAVKDTDTAKALVTKFQPVVDQLSQLGSTLASQKLDTGSLKAAVDGVIAKFKDNPQVMSVLQPLIDKLKTLMG